MNSAWLIDGDADSSLPPDDRGFTYGDGVFETISAPRGRPRLLAAHFERLFRSCERLAIGAPSQKTLLGDIERLIEPGVDCVVKIVVTRGSGGRGYRPPEPASCRRVVGVFPWPQYPQRHYTDGIRVIRCNTRLAENPALAGMKHLCRLENVLAQREVSDAQANEGLMQSCRGDYISGTMSNLFVVVGDELHTPALERCGVAGVMRGAIIQSAREAGVRVRETVVGSEMLHSADELFVSNTLIGIWPITVLEDIAFPVGSLTQSLMRQLGIDSSNHI